MPTTGKPKLPTVEPTLEIEIPVPIAAPPSDSGPTGGGESESLRLEVSLIEPPNTTANEGLPPSEIVDILGSAVAESTGWTPPEAVEDN